MHDIATKKKQLNDFRLVALCVIGNVFFFLSVAANWSHLTVLGKLVNAAAVFYSALSLTVPLQFLKDQIPLTEDLQMGTILPLLLVNIAAATNLNLYI